MVVPPFFLQSFQMNHKKNAVQIHSPQSPLSTLRMLEKESNKKKEII